MRNVVLAVAVGLVAAPGARAQIISNPVVTSDPQFRTTPATRSLWPGHRGAWIPGQGVLGPRGAITLGPCGQDATAPAAAVPGASVPTTPATGPVQTTYSPPAATTPPAGIPLGTYYLRRGWFGRWYWSRRP